MTAVLVVALAIIAVIVVAGVILLALILRETWSSRGEWADEDRDAGEDPRRGVLDKDWWAGR